MNYILMLSPKKKSNPENKAKCDVIYNFINLLMYRIILPIFIGIILNIIMSFSTK